MGQPRQLSWEVPSLVHLAACKTLRKSVKRVKEKVKKIGKIAKGRKGNWGLCHKRERQRRNMEKRKKMRTKEREGENKGKYNDGEQYTPSEPSDSKEGAALGTNWALV